jgi:hypothetical protein
MSTPKNHHYVSRVLSNNFLSEDNRIYRYSKVNKRISALNSTKGLFSKQQLNSVVDEHGNVDHRTVEQEISLHFEKDFPKHYKVVMDMLAMNHEIGTPIPNSEEVINASMSMIEMGMIGRIRHPLDMFRSENSIFGAIMGLANGLDDKLRESMLSHYVNKGTIPHGLHLDYPELSKGMVELMGEATYSIMLAAKDHYFFLPDCTSATKRFKMKDDIIDGKVFINPAMVVGLVIMPINSKVLLAATKTELVPGRGHGTYILSEDLTIDYNRIFFENSIFELACENREYLQKHIQKLEASSEDI